MNSEATQRSVVAVVVGLVVALAIYRSVPSVPLAPQGIFLPIAPIAASASKEVIVIYDNSTAPANHRSLGFINVEYASPVATPQGEAQVVEYASNLAQKAGANGMIITVFGHTSPGAVQKPLASYIFRGMAIQGRS